MDEVVSQSIGTPVHETVASGTSIDRKTESLVPLSPPPPLDGPPTDVTISENEDDVYVTSGGFDADAISKALKALAIKATIDRISDENAQSYPTSVADTRDNFLRHLHPRRR